MKLERGYSCSPISGTASKLVITDLTPGRASLVRICQDAKLLSEVVDLATQAKNGKALAFIGLVLAPTLGCVPLMGPHE